MIDYALLHDLVGHHIEKERNQNWFILSGRQLLDYPNVTVDFPPFKTTTHELGHSKWHMSFRQEKRRSSVGDPYKCKVRFYPNKRNEGITIHWTEIRIYQDIEDIFWTLEYLATDQKTKMKLSKLPGEKIGVDLTLQEVVEAVKKIGPTEVLHALNNEHLKELGDYRLAPQATHDDIEKILANQEIPVYRNNVIDFSELERLFPEAA